MLGVCTLVFLVGSLFAQEPDPSLIRSLDAVEPGSRVAGAERLAAMGPKVEKWLHKKIGSGSANRQRSLLLAAALLGTEESWQIIEEEARRGRRPQASRAYSLLLYGVFHPKAGINASDDWRRASSDFEKSCLLTGLLASHSVLDLDGFHSLIDRRGTPRQKTLLGMLEALQGHPRPGIGETGIERGYRLLVTLLPGQAPMPVAEINSIASQLPEVWSLACVRTPGRTLKQLKGLPLGGESGAVVFSLREMPEGDRQATFDFLKKRIQEDPSASWLWGEAGNMGLDLSRPLDAEVTRWELAGILRLSLRNFPAAAALAKKRATASRAALAGRAKSEENRFHAALMLALAGEPEDHLWFKEQLETGSPEIRAKLQPFWLLATRKLDKSLARTQWLSGWSRELGASSQGFLDREGPRWVALALVSGSLAAREKGELQGFTAPFLLELDHPFTDEFYADLTEFLLSSHYQWNLP